MKNHHRKTIIIVAMVFLLPLVFRISNLHAKVFSKDFGIGKAVGNLSNFVRYELNGAQIFFYHGRSLNPLHKLAADFRLTAETNKARLFSQKIGDHLVACFVVLSDFRDPLKMFGQCLFARNSKNIRYFQKVELLGLPDFHKEQAIQIEGFDFLFTKKDTYFSLKPTNPKQFQLLAFRKNDQVSPFTNLFIQHLTHKGFEEINLDNDLERYFTHGNQTILTKENPRFILIASVGVPEAP